MFDLHLNIDHFATLRNARGGNEPNPVAAALQAEIAGATGIVAHLRADRRHIQDRDIVLLKDAISTKLNMEMSTDDDIMQVALKVKPTISTLVPEKPNEVTTEGGLDVIKHLKHIKTCTEKLHDKGIKVSLFIEPEQSQIDAALEIGADIVEFHTGNYAVDYLKGDKNLITDHLNKISIAAEYAIENNLTAAAGHSLNYINIRNICQTISIDEYNIGHAIVARAAMVGIRAAVREMIDTIIKYKTFYNI